MRTGLFCKTQNPFKIYTDRLFLFHSVCNVYG